MPMRKTFKNLNEFEDFVIPIIKPLMQKISKNKLFKKESCILLPLFIFGKYKFDIIYTVADTTDIYEIGLKILVDLHKLSTDSPIKVESSLKPTKDLFALSNDINPNGYSNEMVDTILNEVLLKTMIKLTITILKLSIPN